MAQLFDEAARILASSISRRKAFGVLAAMIGASVATMFVGAGVVEAAPRCTCGSGVDAETRHVRRAPGVVPIADRSAVVQPACCGTAAGCCNAATGACSTSRRLYLAAPLT